MTEIDYAATASSSNPSPPSATENSSSISHWKRLNSFLFTNYLVISVLLTVLISLTFPIPGAYLNSIQSGGISVVSFTNICIVFFISGLTLKLNEITNLYQHWQIILYSLASINFITTFLAFGLRVLPFQTTAFPIGLTIFASVPTTLGVGITLTLAAKGDQILATFLTILSNLVGIGSVPILLSIYLNNSSVQLNPLSLCLTLTYTVLLPTLGGILTQSLSAYLRAQAVAYRTELAMFSTLNLCMVLIMTLSASQPTLLLQSPVEIILVVIAAAVMHILYLVCNYYICLHVFRFPLPQAIASIILSSQKSSPVALSVITAISNNDTSKIGLLVIPCIIGQLTQIFIGSFVTKYFLYLHEQLAMRTEEEDDAVEQEA